MNWLALQQPMIPLRTLMVLSQRATFITAGEAGCNCSACAIVGMAASAAFGLISVFPAY